MRVPPPPPAPYDGTRLRGGVAGRRSTCHDSGEAAGCGQHRRRRTDRGPPLPVPAARRAGDRRHGGRAVGGHGVDRPRVGRGGQRGGQLRREFLAVERGAQRAGPGQRGHRPGGHPHRDPRGPAASDADHPDRPAADPAGPADRAGQLPGSGHPPAQRDHPDDPRPGRQCRPARGRGVRRRRRAGHRPAARPAFADPGRRTGALSAGHHRRHLRRQGSTLDRGAQPGHRLCDHRRQAAVRAGVGRARGRWAQPAAGRVVRRRRRQPRAGRLHPRRRGGRARPDGRKTGAGAARRGAPDGADPVRPGGAARAHQRPPGAGHGDRRPAGAAGG